MEELEANFDLEEQTELDAEFNISVTPTKLSELENDTDFQTGEEVTETVNAAIEEASSNYATAEQGALADSALQPGDDISELVNDAGYITEVTSQDVTTALGYTPYDSANPNDYQENVIEVIQRNGTALTPENKTVNITVPTTAADVGALPDTTTINDLTTAEQQNALNSGATTTNIGQITTNQNNITTINGKIPAQASDTNQLADKNFVNSSISTNTANFIGTFEDVTTLEAYSGTVTNNDYAFVINSVVTDNGSDWADFATLDAADKSKLTNFDYAWVVNGSNFDLYRFDIVEQEWSLRVQNTTKADVTLNTAYNRYKATEISNVITWAYEYTLNNSSFTASQWAAINSGATTTNIALIGTINTTISGYGNIVTHDTSEFATAAQGTKADTALQNLATGGTQAIALGTLASATASGSIAYGYSAGATSTYSMAIGWDAGATNTNTIAIGKGAKATASGAIALGTGAENSTANTFQVKTYELLDLSNGLIPDARIPSNIARTTDIPSDYVTTNTAQTISQTKAFSQPIVMADNNGLASGTLLSNKKVLQRSSGDSTLTLNNTDNKLRLVGSETRPKYSSDGINFEELVLLSDVPPGSVVDQTFDGTSSNAQSGQAILPVLYSSKGYTESGQVYSDSTLYNDVYAQYSTATTTATDTINRYEVIGTPTIVNNIVSNFSASNYIISKSYKQNLGNASSWSIEIPIITPPSNAYQFFLTGGNPNDTTNYQGFALGFNNLNQLRFFISSDGTSWDIASGLLGSDTFSNNINLIVKFEFTGTQYILSSKKENEDWVIQYTINSTTPIYNTNTELIFGLNQAAYLTPFTGSIDLSGIKVIANNEIIYTCQPSITYVISDDGNKIADVQYRPDVYFANYLGYKSSYFTIDTVNQNVTLPYKDIYGLINRSLDYNYTRIQGYNASATQTLKHVNGVLQWVSD